MELWKGTQLTFCISLSDNSVSSLDEVLVEGQIAGRHNWVGATLPCFLENQFLIRSIPYQINSLEVRTVGSYNWV